MNDAETREARPIAMLEAIDALIEARDFIADVSETLALAYGDDDEEGEEREGAKQLKDCDVQIDRIDATLDRITDALEFPGWNCDAENVMEDSFLFSTHRNAAIQALMMRGWTINDARNAVAAVPVASWHAVYSSIIYSTNAKA